MKMAVKKRILLLVIVFFVSGSGIFLLKAEDLPVSISPDTIEKSVSLQQREEAVAAREKELDQRAKELDAMRQEVDGKLEQIAALQKESLRKDQAIRKLQEDALITGDTTATGTR